MKYLELNEKRLEHPDLFTFADSDSERKFSYNWHASKVGLGEILLALYNRRAFMKPNGQYPTFTEIVEAVSELFGTNLGEASDLARKVRERNDRSKFLRELSDSLGNQ